jgi:Protein of unknown function (DUF1554)
MKLRLSLPVVAATALVAAGCGPTEPLSTLSFFVTSTKNTTGNLGGIRGADALCANLAASVGAGNSKLKTWRAYVSLERDPDNNNGPTDARNRIGNGPWVNANGVTVANNLTELHARTGDATVFVDERGQKIPGQWTGSPSPVEHDILTGSTADGRLIPGMTCSDWTSASATLAAQVGHSDGLGPSQSTTGTLSSWNSAHANASCADTAPRGGAGRIYCFATK